VRGGWRAGVRVVVTEAGGQAALEWRRASVAGGSGVCESERIGARTSK
jgi:hypothetical protein